MGVLLAAVSDGVGRLDWRQDGFAYAEDRDEATQRYAGLRAGEMLRWASREGWSSNPKLPRHSSRTERAAGARESEAITEMVGDATPAGAVRTEDVGAASDRKPRRFYGTVELDPLRLTRDAGQIAKAIVQHLTGLVAVKSPRFGGVSITSMS